MFLHGPTKKDNLTTFSVWAPLKESMVLHLVHPEDKELEMIKNTEGYWQLTIADLPNDTLYFYKIDGEEEHPDPASPFQPQGVHGPSQPVNHELFTWTDQDWQGIPLQQMIQYELHVGTFTPEGTFEAIIPRLGDLKATGINTIELMPVNQFPGNRNWGYDGVYPYAVQNTYGGPEGLKKLVDACHREGIAVLLDVVYNHMGPEGNYISCFGPYFTDHYCSPWGQGINLDDKYSYGVRSYFADNAVYWLQQYHLDGLRCDAVHTIFDNSAVHFWAYTHEKVKALEKQLKRPLLLIAESDYNSPKVVQLPEQGGSGFDAQWLDDFHHALYTLLDEEGKDRYYDFGTIEQLAKAYTDGFVYSGEWVKFRKRRHGISSKGLPGHTFVAFNHNHDQVGNRVKGERLSLLINFEQLKLAAAALFLSPYIPMLFMGEEYGEEAPFFYFVSHSEKELIKRVQEGRKKEFEAFLKAGDEFPDPQAEATFEESKLQWHKRKEGKHQLLLQWHTLLIQLRSQHPVLKNTDRQYINIEILNEKAMAMHRHSEAGNGYLVCLFNFSDKELPYNLPSVESDWQVLLDSKQPKWQLQAGNTSEHPQQIKNGDSLSLLPHSAVVYTNEKL